jgi:hypothetical protein
MLRFIAHDIDRSTSRAQAAAPMLCDNVKRPRPIIETARDRNFLMEVRVAAGLFYSGLIVSQVSDTFRVTTIRRLFPGDLDVVCSVAQLFSYEKTWTKP